jgi:HlyD family secretion protein
MQMKRSWWIGLAALVLLGAWWALSRRQPVAVEIGIVGTGPLRITVDETGNTRARDHLDVSAVVTGRFVPSGVKVGDSVSGASLIGTLYPAPLDATAQAQARAHLGALEAAERQAAAHLKVAQGAAEDARRTLGRTERLAATGSVSEQDLERARLASDAAASDVDAARQLQREASFELASGRSLVASFSDGAGSAIRVLAHRGGRILRLYEEHERVVAAGTPLVQVGDPAELELVIPVLSEEAPRIHRGAEVRFTASTARDTLLGRVTLVEPAAFTKISALGVEEQRVNIIASVPARSGLGDQYRVEARITVWESGAVLRVPTAALVREGDAWAVFVVREGRARRAAVSIGERGTEMAEVRGGLESGTPVILYPADRIADGTRVRAGR